MAQNLITGLSRKEKEVQNYPKMTFTRTHFAKLATDLIEIVLT